MPADLPPRPFTEEILVIAPRLPSALGERAYSSVTLDQDALARDERVDEALNKVPGVALFRRNSSLSANATTQGLSLRAIGPSGAGRALVTLDGIPLNDPFGGWVIWSELQPETLGTASIVRGAGTGPYGAGALTGTVALTSKTAQNPFEADASVGALGSWRGGARADLKAGATQLRFSGASQSFDGFVPVRGPARGRADIRADYDSFTSAARLTAGPASNRFSLALSHFHERRGAGLTGADSASDGTAGSATFVRQPTDQSLGYRLVFWGRHSDLANRSVAIAVGRNSTQPSNDQFATPALGFGFNAALRRDSAQRSWEIGVDARYADGESRERFRNQGAGFTRKRIAGGEQRLIGLYGEGAITHGPWLYTAGLRADYWSSAGAKRLETNLATGAVTLDQRSADRAGIALNGRLAVRRDFANGVFARAAGYTGFRPPTLNELHRPFRVANDITEANPQLTPEHLYGIELGTGIERKALGFSLALFANRLTDPIANVTIGVGPGNFPLAGFVPAGGTLRQRQNAGRIDAYGIEADGFADLSENVALRAALSATHARVNGLGAAPQLTGKRPAQAPAVTATAGLIYRPSPQLTCAFDARYESTRFDDDLNTRRLSPSVTADARIELQLTAHASIYASADNLFDAKIASAVSGDGVTSYAAPRIVRLGVHLQ